MSIDWNSYGVDTDGPTPDAGADNCVIVIPPHVTVSNITLSQLPNPLLDDGNYGIHLYLYSLDILRSH